MLCRRDIEADGRGYLIDQLKVGRTLSQLLAPRLTAGSLYALVPCRHSSISTDDVRGGAIYTPEEGREAYDMLKDGIVAFVQAGQNNVCLIEHPLAFPSDPSVLRSGFLWTSYGDEVYLIVNRSTAIPDNVERVTRWASHHGWLACMTSYVSGIRVPDLGGEFSAEALAQLASRAERVAADSFDDEAFVYWEPHSR
jgi:hypothetical protein